MHRLIVFISLLLIGFSHQAFADEAKVKLKNGTELRGTIISLDPTSEVVLDLAGYATRIEISDVESIERVSNPTEVATYTTDTKPRRDPVTHFGAIKNCKNGQQYIEVIGENGQELTMDYVSKVDKTLKVTKPRKGLKYQLEEYIIPDYVKINGDIYAVTMIGERAFSRTYSSIAIKNRTKNFSLPATLRVIEREAFCLNTKMDNIIIPDSVEVIGDRAFHSCGNSNYTFEYIIYIPATVKSIGADAFRQVSPQTSPRGFAQCTILMMPSYINTDNSTYFGIDDNAVEDYYRRNGIAY